ncbi:DUF47 family protein [Methanoculleus sp. FWC-SCC1]|uniref:DUF47 family protein n=1 Tax=Methanoculleus frigidifontis TaxID=2584085 RepID=A0ABT8M9F6_9EURY|nr:DUF47 family protein [Methanoculleus sp. FWC-SCC1]MDN7024566.1 DUF47 family protein [Methanoculleus sp. FWC-SCC1]
MGERSRQKNRKNDRGIIDSILPREYDFEGMLADQAAETLAGVRTLVHWLDTEPLEKPAALLRIEEDVDEMRYDMEAKLIDAFSTPFDRQDIYTISRRMDYILNFSKETAQEMHAFGVRPDVPIRAMAAALLRGTEHVADAVNVMSSDRVRVEEMIQETREAINEIEAVYITSMAELLHTDDAMNALRKREIYHHLRDAGRALRDTVDILHTAVVGLT